MSLRIRSLTICLLISSLVAACGDDAPPPPPDVDGGVDAAVLDATLDAPMLDATTDAPMLDAGAPDLGECADADGDGSHASSCGGTDCDDTNALINDTADEICNLVDDDCDGSIDELDCSSCPTGFVRLDGMCMDIDECVMGPCGAAAGAMCTNLPGSYTCTCPAGFVAPATAGTCVDLDECAAAINPCGTLGSCVNTFGSYTCGCPPGYTASGGVCVNINECATNPCGTASTACIDTPGSYTCTCIAGYAAGGSGGGGACTDLDECALGTDDCGSAAVCMNTVGSFTCSSP